MRRCWGSSTGGRFAEIATAAKIQRTVLFGQSGYRSTVNLFAAEKLFFATTSDR